MEQRKVLCFHGFGTNSDVLTFQLKQFKREFQNLDFVTLNGPIQMDKNIIMDEKLARMIEDSNIYSWGSFVKMTEEDIYKGFEPGMNVAIKTLKEDGPFYGVMGFSQGSNIVARLATLIAKNEIDIGYELKCFIFVSGMPSQLPYGQQPLCRVPSLHFIGLNDFLVDRSMALSTQFLNPLIIYHNQGHRIPILTYEQVKQLKRFFDHYQEDWSKIVYIPKL